MTQSTPVLTWQTQARQGAPLAVYTLDFSIDLVWTFNLSGYYLSREARPAGVEVDNSGNAQSITVSCGPLNVVVYPYSRLNIDLPTQSFACTFTGVFVSAGNVATIAFYLTDPPAAQASGLMKQLAIQVAALTNASTTTLGTMNPIVNPEFALPDLALFTTVAGTGAPIYVTEGWVYNAPAAGATFQRATGTLRDQWKMAKVGRAALNAVTGAVQLMFALTTADTAAFVGESVSLTFDLILSGAVASSGVTASLFLLPGLDQSPSTVAGGTLLVQQTFTANGRQTLFKAGPLGVVSTNYQLGVVFSYSPTGVAAANEFFGLSRVQLDIGASAPWRPVPLAMEQARCLYFYETLNPDLVSTTILSGGMLFTSSACFCTVPYIRKRAVPVLTMPTLGQINSTLGLTAITSISAPAAAAVTACMLQFNVAGTPYAGIIGQPATIFGGQIVINARL